MSTAIKKTKEYHSGEFGSVKAINNTWKGTRKSLGLLWHGNDDEVVDTRVGDGGTTFTHTRGHRVINGVKGRQVVGRCYPKVPALQNSGYQGERTPKEDS